MRFAHYHSLEEIIELKAYSQFLLLVFGYGLSHIQLN